LRKVSPNAEKNWHQNSGAKRRVVIRDVDMVLLLALAVVCGSACAAASLNGRARLGDAGFNHYSDTRTGDDSKVKSAL
jgi:hypothetical protein